MIRTFVELVRQRAVPRMAVAEVGVWSGDTALGWVPIVSRAGGHSVLVDNFKGNPTAVGDHAARIIASAEIREQLISRMRPFAGVSVVEGDSAESAKQFSDRYFDLVFLDADHRYSKVSQDIRSWLPKVKVGGWLCGHDFEEGWYWGVLAEKDYVLRKHHGVIKAVRTLLPGFSCLAETCWQYQVQ